MLSDFDFGLWCGRNRIPTDARAIIEQIRKSEPTRRVRSAAGNVSGRYPSRKMGRTIQFESHRGELAAILIYEHAPEICEFWDQPPTIKLNYHSRNGKPLGVPHTADFFVIREDGAGWEECKMEAELQRLMEHNPQRYVRSATGEWQCPPGAAYAQQYGLSYRVRSSAEIDWVWQRNILFLEDYLRVDAPTVEAEAQNQLCALIQAHPGIALSTLIEQTRIWTADDIYHLIVTDEVFVDLSAAPLAEPGRVRVFATAETARALAPILSEIGIQGLRMVSDDQSQFDVASATPDELAQAAHRYTVIAPLLRGEAVPTTVSRRACFRWLQRYRAAEALQPGAGFVGLIPHQRERGNRTARLPEATRMLMNEFIETQYETVKQKGKKTVYGSLARECEARGLKPPCYLTLCRAINQRPQAEQVYKRRGHRAASVLQPCYLELTLTTPRHGDRPFEIVHLDHTEMDVELICSRTGRNLGRPWWTMMTDAFSRRILAFFLTFDPPSYRSCMMALRECVRRHQRFPQCVVVDGGKEFAGVYFETLLARYECTKKTRPPAQPRFGSVCERLLGTSNTQLIHNLAGNTQITKNVRLVTKGVDPKCHAQWTLPRLSERLCEWAYEVYDTTEHPALGMSPRGAFEQGIAHGGHRAHREVAYDQEFLLWTLPTTTRGQARVEPGRGIKIHYIYYWSQVFRDPTVEQTQVPVRYDPYDIGVAFAYVGHHWVQCISEYYSLFHGRSEREIALATAELRRGAQEHARRLTVTAKKLAVFLDSIEAEEALWTQRLKDRETQSVLASIEVEQIVPQAGNPQEPAPAAACSLKSVNWAELEVYDRY